MIRNMMLGGADMYRRILLRPPLFESGPSRFSCLDPPCFANLVTGPFRMLPCDWMWNRYEQSAGYAYIWNGMNRRNRVVLILSRRTQKPCWMDEVTWTVCLGGENQGISYVLVHIGESSSDCSWANRLSWWLKIILSFGAGDLERTKLLELYYRRARKIRKYASSHGVLFFLSCTLREQKNVTTRTEIPKPERNSIKSGALPLKVSFSSDCSYEQSDP